ncbi:hypothetical protein PVAP13_3NG137802 [Panicum virgatum]|uniref:Uncharacterized protein n=1 Tax=Panicum virgatum TaxID=38727 RepID=A0A8T0U586_PANVG|nr:hypothetical protein PVAP13_3NG137802 [Panicum virgatum]
MRGRTVALTRRICSTALVSDILDLAPPACGSASAPRAAPPALLHCAAAVRPRCRPQLHRPRRAPPRAQPRKPRPLAGPPSHGHPAPPPRAAPPAAAHAAGPPESALPSRRAAEPHSARGLQRGGVRSPGGGGVCGGRELQWKARRQGAAAAPRTAEEAGRRGERERMRGRV